MQQRSALTGFTLIELSIVLVIIGLIIGGILTGQDLINAATIRAQISQIEKYNTAVRTFQNKYGYLPGDIPNPYATQFGFITRGTSPGEGNGDGILQGYGGSGNTLSGGETAVFWVDLSTAGLIDANLKTAVSTNYVDYLSSAAVPNYFPAAKMGNANYVYAYSGGYFNENTMAWVSNGFNYYGISAVNGTTFGAGNSTTAMTVQQAFNIDSKVDDGLPQSGGVQACYMNYNTNTHTCAWAAGNGVQGANNNWTGNDGPPIPTNAATPYAITNCYDNAIPGSAAGTGGQAGLAQTYSLSQNANVQNCALSFQFQ